MLETAAYWLIGIGVAFELIGCIGLLRLPDVYDRAVAATKCVTMGTCMMLIGVALYGLSGAVMDKSVLPADAATGANWGMVVKALICAGFVLLTSPTAAHAVLRGAYISGVPMSKEAVEDAFVERAKEIRREVAAQNEVDREEAQT